MNEKQTQIEKVEQRLKTLHGKFTDNYEHSGKRFNLLKDQLVKIESQIELQRQAREELMQSKQQEMGELQQKIASLIAEEMRTREDSELRLRKQIQEKALSVQ